MKPKNKFQKQVFELSKKLPPLTKVQEEWACHHCFEHVGRKTAKGIITCLNCGHTWQGNSHLADVLLGAECSACSVKLTVSNTRKRVFKQAEYFCIVTVKENFQVLRFFLVQYYARAGKKAQYSISEVTQRWIAPTGKYTTIAKKRPLSYYDVTWNLSSKLEIRPERDHHYINPSGIYPRQRLIPELKRGGYKGDCHKVNPFDLFLTLLTDSRAETLLKAGQTKVLKYFAGKSFHRIDNYWASIKICIRNNYQISDVSIWRDYLDLLRFFGKDLHNAKYVCPCDLKAEHDRYVKKKKEWQKRQDREEARKKALEDEKRFFEMKSRFFGIQFTDGLIQVRVLESVDEIMQEGDAMHHCVFTNEYHLKPDTLILSARIEGRRIETVALSLSQLKVLQCRGVCNQNTAYHDRIIRLVKKNISLIKKRIAA